MNYLIKKKNVAGGSFGYGRKTNPNGPDGQPIKCHKCGSTTHLQRDCKETGGKNAPAFPVRAPLHMLCDARYAYPSHAGPAPTQEVLPPFHEFVILVWEITGQ